MKKLHEHIKKISESKVWSRGLRVAGVILAVLVIFSAGMITGFSKASFGHDWDDHYEQNFGMGHAHMGPLGNVGEMKPGYFPNAYGAIGKIIKIESPTLIVEDKDGTEKVIVTTDNTNIEKVRQFIKLTDLQVDDFVVVVGSPNPEGQIEAKFIRVIPAPDLPTNAIPTNPTDSSNGGTNNTNVQ